MNSPKMCYTPFFTSGAVVYMVVSYNLIFLCYFLLLIEMQMVCCVTMVDQLFFASIFIFKDEQLRLINFFTNNAIRMVWIGRFSFL